MQAGETDEVGGGAVAAALVDEAGELAAVIGGVVEGVGDDVFGDVGAGDAVAAGVVDGGGERMGGERGQVRRSVGVGLGAGLSRLGQGPRGEPVGHGAEGGVGEAREPDTPRENVVGDEAHRAVVGGEGA